MIIKNTPQDFIVEEIYNLDSIKDRDEERKQPYHYFILTKTNYNQLRALQIIARTFNTSPKLVHFAGTKDKVGITKQVVSVYGINEDNFKINLDHFNEQEDLHLEHIGEFKSRIGLGDNLGNHFKIVVRDIEKSDIELAKTNIEKLNKQGVLNFFDEQRFGYANNSHIVGKYVLQNQIEKAVYEIMSSLPSNSQSELLSSFNDFITKNWQAIKEQNIEIIDQALEVTPRYLENEANILNHLKKHKNDFPGAFRTIHKKLRTLFVNAYQSYIFNESIIELNKKDLLNDHKQLELINKDTQFDKAIHSLVQFILQKDNLTQDSFKLPHMPELKIRPASRETKIFPKNIKLNKQEKDDIFENKLKVLVEFDLGSGEYATNVVKQIFYK